MVDLHKDATHAPIISRLRNESDSVTVSYRTVGKNDPVYATTIGYGANVAARIADADDQLPAGEWLRLCVSTPVSIYTDLTGRDPLRSFTQGPNLPLAYKTYENKVVSAP